MGHLAWERERLLAVGRLCVCGRPPEDHYHARGYSGDGAGCPNYRPAGE